ncbi:MAG: hypothetical protein EOM25_08385, partial [Deltaproteobacteria bacterium]|nr:hypothetical protein [Deltaproteobacteria bacterium]
MKSFLLACIVLICFPALTIGRAGAETRPLALIFCHEDQNAFPWVFPAENGTGVVGLDLVLIDLLSKELNIPIATVGMPWKRCLRSLETQEVHGAFASSFVAERQAQGRYPELPNGGPDPDRRIHTSGYSLYVPDGSTLDWNGTDFLNLNGTLGIQSGFSVAENLDALGAAYEENAGVEANLEKVLRNRIQGAVLQTQRADHVLTSDSRFRNSLKKAPIPISEKPYYLMLSF